MLNDIILGMVSSAAGALLVKHSLSPASVSKEDYAKAIRFLQHYSARRAYLSTDINCWGDEAQC
jgi:hypothetical protein